MLNDQDPVRSLVQKMADFPVVVKSDGMNSMTGEVSTISGCNMHMTFFPNDIQLCQIKITSLPIGVE